MTELCSLADKIIQKAAVRKTKRLNFEKKWQDVSELVLPRKADFTVKNAAGVSRGRKLFETTAVHAAELLAAGVHGMMTNPAGKWFALDVPELSEREDVKSWLVKAEQVMNNEILRPCAGFSSNIHEVYLDLAVLGTAGFYVGWNENEDSLLFQSRFLGELFIEEDAVGRVCDIVRVFSMNVEKIVRTWGENVLPERLKSAYVQGDGENDELEIIHAVYPNPDYKKGDVFQKPYSSVYVLKDDRCVLFAGGFEELPLFVVRWAKACAEAYGCSPAVSVLPDIKMIQEMMRETIISAQLANRPPLMVRDDDQIAPLATVPGGIIRYSGEAPKAFVSGANSSVGLEIMNEVRARIRSAFYLDQLTTVSDVRMTATEVVQRTEENLRLLGPVFGRLQTELLGPMLSRVFGLLVRHGKIPPAPDGIGFSDIVVEYCSPLSMVQKNLEVGGITRTLEMSEALLKICPDASAVFDAPAAIRKIGKMYGVGSDLFHADPILKEKVDEPKQQ